MKTHLDPTALHPLVATTPHHAQAKVRAAVDRLVDRAARGDRRAIGALAVAFHQTLHDAVVEVIDDDVDADDVLQDFYVRLLERRWTFVAGRHDAVQWLKANVRALARADDP